MGKLRKGRQTRRLRRRTYQPEQLEARQLLAADPIVVDLDHLRDSEDPSNQFTSLREAIALADANPGPDTITFAPNLNFGTITATGGELVINSEVTIDASSAGLLRIGRQRGAGGFAEHRIFRIAANANVVMNNVIIQGGRAGYDEAEYGGNYGGGIYNEGTLRLTNSVVGGNVQFAIVQTGQSRFGGGAGIYSARTATLELVNSHVGALEIDEAFYTNVGLDPQQFRGSSGQPELVPNNQAQGTGSGIFNVGNLLISSDSSISYNRSNYQGAGIYSTGVVSITDSHITGNRVDGGTSAGGGIANYGSLTIERSTIDGNIAYSGGGIYSESGELSLIGSEIVGNTSNQGNGGGLHLQSGTASITRSLFEANQAGDSGGAIYSRDTLAIRSSTIVNNTANEGGAIFAGCRALLFCSTTNNIANSTITRNTSRGSGVFTFSGSATVRNSILSDNVGQDIEPIANLFNPSPFTSNGYNILEIPEPTSTAFRLQPTDRITSQPSLGPLGDFGGPTRTIGLLPDSPALNSGPAAVAAGTLDQRGQPRLEGPAVDRGAFESTPLVRMEVDHLPGKGEVDVADGYYAPGEISLSDAVAWANAIPGHDTIRFSQALLDQIESDFDGSATITLGSQLNITDDLTILGPGAKVLSLSGDKRSRIFQIEAGVSLDLRDLTLTQGQAPTTGASANNGGAIANFGDLALQRVEITDSHAPRLGGAISTWSGSTLSIQSSTLAGNTAAKGGGFYSRGDVQVENSTLAENFGSEFGGGFVSFAGTVTLDHSTIVANHALLNSGGFRNEGALVELANTVVSKNTSSVDADYSQDPTFPDGQVTMGPFNFVGSSIDPLLGPLRDLGGPTRTVGILPTSPLIDAADPASSRETDQRGFTRPIDSRRDDDSGPADIGAFEYVAPDFTEGDPIVVDHLDPEAGGIADGYFAAGEFTLPEAVLFAAELPGANTIQFDESFFVDDDGQPVSHHIALERTLRIFDELEIIGPGADLLSIHVGTAATNGFDIAASGTATLRDLTIDGDQVGRGINNAGDLTLDRAYVTNGYAEEGGGLFNAGNATLNRSTIANSTADSFGGGVFNQGFLVAANSTLSSNQALDGGGLWNEGGATTSFLQSTISNNRADARGGIFNAGTVLLQSTIVAANDETITRSRSDIGNIGTITSNGYNLIGDLALGAVDWTATDLVGEEPQLTDLVSIRGSIPMHGLLPSSPAVDAAGTLGQPLDQTGTARPLPVGGAYDIGAFEAKELFWTGELVVTDLSDVLDAEYEQGLTLREAILWANRKDASNREGQPDRITIDADLAAAILADFEATGAGITVELGSDLLIEDAVEISPFSRLERDALPQGLLQLTADGNHRIFTVLETAQAVIIEDLTVMGGGGVEVGGGIYTAADLELSNAVVRDNSSELRGGGIAVDGTAKLLLEYSSVLSNGSVEGGAVHSAVGATVDIAYSSIEGNKTSNQGSGGGVLSHGELVIMSSTFAGNDAPTGGAFSSLGSLEMVNTTISGNRGGGLQVSNQSSINNSTIYDNAGTAIHNLGQLRLNNSILYKNGNDGVTPQPPDPDSGNNIIGEDPLLLSLANNGGPTRTHALNPNSPAIDAGDPAYTPIVDQRGRPMVDIPGIGGSVVDIGAYEVQSIVNSDWNYSARGRSQFGEGDASVFGFGFDDGRAGRGVDPDPVFIGVPFDTGPMTLGGIADILGAKFGGEVRADFAGRVGFDLGVYANSGSVDVDYSGMLNYVIDEDPATGVIDVATFLAIDEGSLYTVSPKLGAYMDLVLELDASIGASGCLFGCVGFDVPFKIDEKIEMFAINRQARDAAGQPAFLDTNGNVVVRQGTESLGEGVVPFFDGDIRIAGLNLWAPPIDVGPNDLQAKADQELAGERLANANARLAQGNNEINRIDEMAKKQGLNPDALTGELKRRREAAIQNVIKANNDKTKLDADVKKSNPARNGKRTLGGGSGLQVSFAEASGSLLGVKGTVSAVAESARFDRSPAIIEAGISKQIGSLALTMPDVNLRDVTPAGSAGRLSASTSEFPKNSESDEKRQLANLQLDVAGLLGPLLGIPAGRYAASLGPLSLTAQLISYDLGPQLNVTQDISAVPQAKQVEFWLDTNEAIVSVNGVNQPLEGVDDVPGYFSFTFKPGDRVSIDPAGDGPIRVTPRLTMDVQFQNDLGLDIDLQGALEALSVGLNVGNNEIIKVGPLISEKHNLGTLDLGSIYKETWNLFEQTIGLESFTIGGGSQDGTTADSALMGDVSPDGLTASVTEVKTTDLPIFFSKDVVTDSGDQFWPQVEYSVGDNQIKSLYVLHDDLTIEILDNQGDVIDTLVPMMGRELVLEAPTATLRISGFRTDILAESSRVAVALKFEKFDSEGDTSVAMELVGPSESLIREDVTAGNVAKLDQEALDNLGATVIIGFDVDGDGLESPLTDGILLMRYMDGLQGEALVANALGKDATRDADQIRAYIDEVLDRTERLESGDKILTLDIDHDGLLKSNTDGQLIARFLAGFTGTDLMSGVVSVDGERTDPGEIAAFLRLGRVTTNNEVVMRPDENDILVMSQGVGFDEVIQFGGGFDVFGVDDALDASNAPVGAAVGNPTSQAVEGAAAELAAMPQSATPLAAAELQTFGFILSNFGETITYNELWLDDNRISRVAQGAPFNYANRRYEGLHDEDLNRLERRTTTSVLGREEPIYVQAPDAAGYTYKTLGGYEFETISIDLQVGDNGYLGEGFDLYRGLKFADADGEEMIRWEFEAFIQEGNPQFDSGDGILVYKPNQPLETFRLFPTALPNVDIHQVDNLSAPKLITTTGFTLLPGNDAAQKPAIEMTQIAHRKAPHDPPAVALPVHIEASLAESLEHQFSISRRNESAIVSGSRAYAAWGAVTEFVQLASANQISIVGSDNANDTLQIESIGGPVHTPIHFDGGARADTVVFAGEGILLDLVTRDRFTGVETIDIRGTGANQLELDVESLVGNGGLAHTVRILADDDDVLGIGSGWEQVDVRDGFEILQQNGITIEFSVGGLLRLSETVEPLAPTQDAVPSWPTIILNQPEELSPIVKIVTPEAHEAPLNPPADPMPEATQGQSLALHAIVASLSDSTLAAGESVSLDVELDPSDGRTTGLHLRVHFDSTRIDIQRDEVGAPVIAGVFGEGLSAVQVQADGPCVESDDATRCRGFDQDELTDKYVNLLWLDANGQWPANAEEIAKLLSLNFVAREGFDDMTTVRFTGDVGGGVILEPLARRVFNDDRVDLNSDGKLDAADVDFLFAAIRAGEDTQRFDLNNDEAVDRLDSDVLVREVFRTYRGDVDLDGRFDSNDLVSVFQSGEYEDGIDDNSTWAEGDWDGNGEFDSGDLVVAFQDGGYERGARGILF